MSIKKMWVFIILLALMTGCSTSPFVAHTDMKAEFKKAPAVTPFYDDYWLLLEDLTFEATRTSDGKHFSITVPAGFVTDLASIPVPLNVIYDKSGRSSSAGILHDYLSWTQFCDRKKSDRMIKEGLKATGQVMSQETLSNMESIYWVRRLGLQPPRENSWRRTLWYP
ncbi:MAG: DUF1353 domain-containing protein [Nitrosomonadales bacterium]|nr:DUF1353 domain-containing protein [Nitrosomonadales bacterium]